MKNLIAAMLIGGSALIASPQAHAIRIEPTIIVTSSPKIVSYHSNSFYYYSNGLLVPTNHYYNRTTFRNMAVLSRAMGLRHVYLLPPTHPYGVPTRYHRTAAREFSRYGLSYGFYYSNVNFRNQPHFYSTPNYYENKRFYKNKRNSSNGIYFRFSF